MKLRQIELIWACLSWFETLWDDEMTFIRLFCFLLWVSSCSWGATPWRGELWNRTSLHWQCQWGRPVKRTPNLQSQFPKKHLWLHPQQKEQNRVAYWSLLSCHIPTLVRRIVVRRPRTAAWNHWLKIQLCCLEWNLGLRLRDLCPVLVTLPK